MYYRTIYERVTGHGDNFKVEKLETSEPIFTSRRKATERYFNSLKEFERPGNKLYKQIEGRANSIKRHRGFLMDFLFITFYEISENESIHVMLKVSYDKKYM